MELATVQISDTQKRQYESEGYFILDRVIPKMHLDSLRGECQRFIDRMHDQMDAAGTDVIDISHRNKRYFVANPSLRSAPVRDFLFSSLMADICRATIGPEAYLHWEQYVVKAAEVGLKFGWHQDSSYVSPAEHRPYVSCWCALDDMSEANGTIYVLPYSRAGTRHIVEHRQEQGTNDLIGYAGTDAGEPVLVPAGSIAVFSSFTFHRSGPNTTDKMRRVYLAQYSPDVIFLPDGSKPVGRTEQFLKQGKPVI